MTKCFPLLVLVLILAAGSRARSAPTATKTTASTTPSLDQPTSLEMDDEPMLQANDVATERDGEERGISEIGVTMSDAFTRLKSAIGSWGPLKTVLEEANRYKSIAQEKSWLSDLEQKIIDKFDQIIEKLHSLSHERNALAARKVIKGKSDNERLWRKDVSLRAYFEELHLDTYRAVIAMDQKRAEEEILEYAKYLSYVKFRKWAEVNLPRKSRWLRFVSWLKSFVTHVLF
uniref:RxLR effector candidate protein n=1 Tax=Hyaloperonospora arabidopsidis (strain Emoy2) TaxID=559515 RepID=M4BQQ8_HYAAE|nr:RxLR effector candidate protein [Hyaloperonospora arabidopsidis Emoy2]